MLFHEQITETAVYWVQLIATQVRYPVSDSGKVDVK